MPVKSLTTQFVCAVLKEHKLIDEELTHQIRLYEKDYREKLQKNGTAADPKEVDGVDIVSSIGLHSLKDADQILSEEVIVKTLASHWKLPFLKIDLSKLDPSITTSRVSESFVREHLAIPISITENILFVAVTSPLDPEAIEIVKRVSALKVRPLISTKTDVLKAIQKCYETQKSVNASNIEGQIPSKSGPSNKSSNHFAGDNEQHADKNVINAVNLLLRYAFEQRTTEIYIEPRQQYSKIRFRIDGVLYDVKRIPLELHINILLRFKVLAGMNISESHRLQEGRTQFNFHDREINLRISVIPITFGEKIIVRILDPIMLFRHIDNLGFSPEGLERYMAFIARSKGIILITGPAGSGKTTTLYSTLDQLSEKGSDITTIEDPIEVVHESFNQIDAHPSRGVTFETAIRYIAQQASCVIMIGEILEKESVEQTMQAALAGHLLFTALRAYDAPSAIIHLLNMGIQPFLLESTITAVISQRLVRKICKKCARSSQLSAKQIAALQITQKEAKQFSLQKGTGCMECRGTGYMGQTALFEIMEITDEIRSLIHQSAGASAIKNVAINQGMRSFKEEGIEKMRVGITSCDEVLRVTGGLQDEISHAFKSKIFLSQR